MIINEEWIGNDVKEGGMAQFKVLSWNSKEELRNTTKTCQDTRYPDRDFKPDLPKYEAGLLTTSYLLVKNI